MVKAVLPGVRLRGRVLLAAAIALGTCAFAFVAGPARAATPAPSAVTCSGHADRGDDPTLPDRVDVAFGCSGDIRSFTIVSSAPIGGFEVSAEAYDHVTQAIVETDSFFCEGLIPGDGFNCTGAAHAGKDVRTAFETNDPVCSETEVSAPLRLQLVVSDVNGATAGPFRLRGPEKCPKPDVARPAGRRGGKKHRHGRGAHKQHRRAARRLAAR
ncbi:MAG TPA: hypothetical protein VGO48_01230 [Conexibacter sp.]|jgi:hypothetical protein|nr:hypothetical protein [Conexibacter sp.]